MLKVLHPPKVETPDFETVKKCLAEHSEEIMRIVKVLFDKYDRPIEPQEFVLSWFSRDSKIVEYLADDGSNDILGVGVWSVESNTFTNRIGGYIRFLFADDENKKQEILDYIIEACKIANCHTLFYDSGKREEVDDKTIAHIYHELNLWRA